MPEYITVKPAYGKELLFEKEVLQHYLDGKDFMILSLHHGAGPILTSSTAKGQRSPSPWKCALVRKVKK